MAAPRTVLVTGCSTGLGRALAMAFREAGCRVVATARRPESLDLAPEDDLLPLALDVTDADSIVAAIAAAEAWGPGVDVLVNNAGAGLIGPVAELAPEDLRRQLETNVVGPVELTRAVVPGMARRGSGLIVNIGSVSGLTTTPFAGAYCASKAALHALSEAARLELGRFGIRVVVVQPGAVASRFAASSVAAVKRYRSPASLYSDVADSIERRARLSEDRPTPAEDVARVVVEKVLRRVPPAVIRCGRGATLLPLLGRLPRRLRDRLLRRSFDLDGPAPGRRE